MPPDRLPNGDDANDPTAGTDGLHSCDECGQPFKNAQGLAGHRRLAHSASTRSELKTKAVEQAERESTARRREVAVARRVEAVQQREVDLVRRERGVAAIESVPEHERIQMVVADRVRALPTVTVETILRVNGKDYRITEKGDLVHLYWPKGEKTPFEEGARFQFAGRAYCIRGRRLLSVPSSTLLAELLGEQE